MTRPTKGVARVSFTFWSHRTHCVDAAKCICGLLLISTAGHSRLTRFCVFDTRVNLVKTD